LPAPRFAVAPRSDYSHLNTWPAQLQPDCSNLCIACPALPTDLHRRSTLHMVRRLRIAPRPTLTCVSLTNCSVLDTQELLTACGLLRSRCWGAVWLRLLLARRSSPRTVPGLLPAHSLTLRAGLRIAPYSNPSRPRGAHGSLRVRHFKLRTGHKLLCARCLARSSDCRLLRLLPIAPCDARGLLRGHRLEFCTGSGLLRFRSFSLRPAAELLQLRHLIPSSACGLLRRFS